MRFTFFSACLFAALIGCSSTEEPLDGRSEQATTARTESSSASSDTPARAATTVPQEYPEKEDVQRLLSQARALQQQGQFETALGLVHDALALDASSPAAGDLKIRLDEIIRRI